MKQPLWKTSLVGLLLLFTSCQNPGERRWTPLLSLPKVKKGPLIRVLLRESTPIVYLSVPGGFYLSKKIDGKAFYQCHSRWQGKIEPSIEGMAVGWKSFPVSHFFLHPQEGVVKIGNQTYQGIFSVERAKWGRFHLVNHLPLETYLVGVIAGEVPESWPDDALCAQAIASRTYALYHMRQNSKKIYDLRNTTASQVYRGKGSLEMAKIVRETSGRVLTYSSSLFPAFFHSTCGGKTLPASRIFPAKSTPPLAGVKCLYCGFSRHYRWVERIPLDKVREVLYRQKKNLGALKKVTEKEGTITLMGAKKSLTLSKRDFRKIFSVTSSSNFTLSLTPRELRLEGKGFGHRVGLCQYGACGMANTGRQYPEILKYYYPGSKLVKVY